MMCVNIVVLVGRPHVVALHHHELVVAECAATVVVPWLAGLAAALEGREAATRGSWGWTGAAAWIESVDTAAHWRIGIRVVDNRDVAAPRDARYVVDVEGRKASVTRYGSPVHRVVYRGVASFRLWNDLAVEVADIGIVEEG